MKYLCIFLTNITEIKVIVSAQAYPVFLSFVCRAEILAECCFIRITHSVSGLLLLHPNYTSQAKKYDETFKRCCRRVWVKLSQSHAQPKNRTHLSSCPGSKIFQPIRNVCSKRSSYKKSTAAKRTCLRKPRLNNAIITFIAVPFECSQECRTRLYM